MMTHHAVIVLKRYFGSLHYVMLEDGDSLESLDLPFFLILSYINSCMFVISGKSETLCQLLVSSQNTFCISNKQKDFYAT